MKINFKLYISVSLAVICAFCESCKKEDGKERLSESYSKIDTLFLKKQSQILSELDLKLKEMECTGAAICIIYNGKLIQYVSGLRNRDSSHLKIDSASVFRIGSLSKGFAGILASKLIKDGLIDANAPVAKYLPEFKLKAKEKGDSIRVWHILSHSTGLTEHAFSNLIDEKRDKQTLFNSINRMMVRDSTGKRYAYQNATYALIEDIIQTVTGMTYHEALNKHIFLPLNMNSSSSSYEAMMAMENKAFPHRWNGPSNGFIPVDFHEAYYNTPAAGGINSNLMDMTKWLKALIEPRNAVIDDTIKSIAFDRRIYTSWDDKYYNGWDMADSSYYCFGWRRIRLSENDIIFHGGQVNNFRCEIAFNREKQFGLVALFNAHCDLANIITPMITQILDQ
jgi:beta-lactamase class C